MSLVLSGGYEDDVDNGDEFTYTGSGGRELKGQKGLFRLWIGAQAELCSVADPDPPRIRIRRIHMFLGLPDPHPDPLVRDMDPDPAGFFCHQAKIVRCELKQCRGSASF
jgi:hypothetical protein